MATLAIYADQVPASLVSNDPAYAGARGAANADSIQALNVSQYVGQAKEGDNGFYVYRTALIWTIPATVRDITGGKLTLYQSGSTIADAQYMYLLDPEGDIAITGVVLADFGQLLGNTTEWGKVHSSVFIGVAGDRDITLNSTGLGNITPGQKFIVAMRGQHDIDNVADGGFIERNFFLFAGSQAVSTVRRPRLILEYTPFIRSRAYVSG